MAHGLADALVSTGLAAAGFRSLNFDAGVWLHARDAQGDLQADPARFPSGMKAMSGYLAARGLTMGLYTGELTQPPSARPLPAHCPPQQTWESAAAGPAPAAAGTGRRTRASLSLKVRGT